MPTTTLTDKFKTDSLNGIHNFAGASPKIYKMLLIKSGAAGAYDKTLQNVGTPGSGLPGPTNVGTDEVVGTGYTSGGQAMAGVSVTLRTDTACVDWSTNPTWANATISAICAVIYETSTGDVVGVFDFGGTFTSTAGNFTVSLPTPGAATSIVRIS
jgi:hypothetical protein